MDTASPPELESRIPRNQSAYWPSPGEAAGVPLYMPLGGATRSYIPDFMSAGLDLLKLTTRLHSPLLVQVGIGGSRTLISESLMKV